MALPDFSMRQLLEAGVHFGHQAHRWNPKMGTYIFGTRNNIHIIDLAQTVPMLHRALQAVSDTVAKGGRVLFVGTKRQAQDAVADAAKRSAQYYVNSRWLGGTLTNWKTISRSISRLRKLDEMLSSGEAQGYTKKERSTLQRERDKLDRALGGIKDMGGVPDLLFVIDTNKEDIAIKEARRLEHPGRGDRRHQLRSGRHHLSSFPATTTPAARSRSIAISSPRRRSTAFRARRAKPASTSARRRSRSSRKKCRPRRPPPISASSSCRAARRRRRSQEAARRVAARSRSSSTISASSTTGRSPSSTHEAAHNIGEEVGLPGRVDGWIAKAKELTRRVIAAVMPACDAARRFRLGRRRVAATTDRRIERWRISPRRWSRSCARRPARA